MQTALARATIVGWARRKSPRVAKTLYWSSRGHYSRLRQMHGLAKPVYNFLRDQVALERAEEEIKRRLDGREESFLDLVRRQIYDHPPSPYLKLLKHAGLRIFRPSSTRKAARIRRNSAAISERRRLSNLRRIQGQKRGCPWKGIFWSISRGF